MFKSIEVFMEKSLFTTRWLLAPVFFMTPLVLVIIGVKYVQELFGLAIHCFSMSNNDVVLSGLEMLHMILVMGLIIIVIFSGYENFVSKLDIGDHEDRPQWMNHVTFSKMKIWLIATAVAMSSIQILIDLYKIDEMTEIKLAETIALHMVLVVTAVGMAHMDKILHSCGSDKE